MKVTQIYDIMNATMEEVLGREEVVAENLSNIVDVGNEIIDTDNLDNYVRKLVNHIGKVVFVNRIYEGGVPSVLMDSWEFGSILEKVSADLPTATESDTWKLQDGVSYDDDIFYQPSVSAKFFNSKVTFEIPMSFTEIQIKESFSNVNQLNGFLSMLTTSIENAMTVKLDTLIMRTINNMTGETLASDTSGVRAVNLLSDFNDKTGETLTAEEAVRNPEFIQYASYIIALYSDRITRISTVFNAGAKERFTPASMRHVVLLSDFAKASDIFLKSDIANAELVPLPEHETVPYWQGSGTAYDFESVSKIDVKTSTGKDVSQDGVIGVMFDRDALGVSNLDRRVTTNYNASAEFYTNFYKFDAGYFNDLNENYVVFYVSETDFELPEEEPEE